MSLAPGTRLGSFEVLAPLGAGGMGEVYRARDTRLGREVALKVLPDAFARDETRLARFEREARAAAALNHPNILVVFEVGQDSGRHFVASELLEGQTLGAALRQGLPLRKALDFAGQIATGLAAAHAKGIVHRDIKPENLFVTQEGRVKILDFGLARQLEGAGGLASEEETVTRQTSPGVVLGTAAYMSPEQAQGLPVDHRSDIFSFGAVLFEMLSGRRPFAGKTTAELLTAILRDDPPELSELNRAIPTSLARIAGRCLEKNPEERFQSARDIAFALDLGSGETLRLRSGVHRATLWALLAGVLAVGVMGLIGLRLSKDEEHSRPVRRLVVDVPALNANGIHMPFALSPDGARIVYAADTPDGQAQHLYLRELVRFDPVVVHGTEGAGDPFFSPDGQRVGFLTIDGLQTVALPGGAPLTLCYAGMLRGASWSADGRIVFAPGEGEGLWWVPAAGGQSQVLTRPDRDNGEVSHRWPQVLPGGRAVLFTVESGKDKEPFRVDALILATGERRALIESGSYARYLPSGHLIFAKAGTILGVPFDPVRLQVEGPAVTVLENVAHWPSGLAEISIASDGTLAYRPAGATAVGALVWVDRSGQTTPLPAPSRAYFAPRLSPDGQRIAVVVSEKGAQDLWVFDLSNETLTRVTFRGSLTSSLAVWSPDGGHLAYTTTDAGVRRIVLRDRDGAGGEAELVAGERMLWPAFWSRDGRSFAYNRMGPASGGDLHLMSLTGDRQKRPVLNERPIEYATGLSVDGRWVVYVSDESGRFEVYVESFPQSGNKRQITTEGGGEPVWSPEGSEIFYRIGDRMMAVPVRTKPSFAAGKPRLLFEASLAAGWVGLPGYDVTADGQRFLMIRNEEEPPQMMIHVVLNWFEDLKRLAPAR